MGGKVFKDSDSERKTDDIRPFNAHFFPGYLIGNGLLDVSGSVHDMYSEILKSQFGYTNRNHHTSCFVAVPIFKDGNWIHDFEFIRLKNINWKQQKMKQINCNIYLTKGFNIKKHMGNEYRCYKIRFEMNLDNCMYSLSKRDEFISISNVDFTKTLNELRSVVYRNIIGKNTEILKKEMDKYGISWNDIIVIYQNKVLTLYDESIFDNIMRSSYYVDQTISFKGMLVKNDGNNKNLMESKIYVIDIYVNFNKYCYKYIETEYFNHLSTFMPSDIVELIEKFTIIPDMYPSRIFYFGYITVTDISYKNIQSQILQHLRFKKKIISNNDSNNSQDSYTFPFINANGMVMHHLFKENNFIHRTGPIISSQNPIKTEFWRSKNPKNIISILLQKTIQPLPIKYSSNKLMLHIILFYSINIKISQISLILNIFTKMDQLIHIICKEFHTSSNEILISISKQRESFKDPTQSRHLSMFTYMGQTHKSFTIFVIKKDVFDHYKTVTNWEWQQLMSVPQTITIS